MAMVIKGVAPQNGQCDEEKAREVYIDALSVAEVAPMLEAARLLNYSDYDELRFCSNMARMYGCKPLEGNSDNLIKFLVTLYHYGKVQGIRHERTRRKKKRDRELMEIAKTLEGNPLLY
ncbi:MAG: hypothetical protein KH452_05005 [Clostridiales bacterium]|nr:hypothetical protein [Clostridiales bacterium]